MQNKKMLKAGKWYKEYDVNGAVTRAVYNDSYILLIGGEIGAPAEDGEDVMLGSIHPEDVSAVKRHLADVFAADSEVKDYDIEYRMMTVRGYRCFHDCGHPIRRRDGSVSRIDGFLFDVQGMIDREEEAKQQVEQARNEIITRMADALSMYILNPKTKRFRILKQNDYLSKNYPSNESYMASITRYIENDVFEPDRKMTREALSVKTLISHVETENEYKVRFRDVSKGVPRWYQMRAVKLSESEIIFGFSDRTEEVFLEGLTEKIIKDQYVMFSVDMDSELITVLKNESRYPTGPVGDSAPYSIVMRAFASELEGDASRFFYRMSDLKNVREALMTEDKYTYSYQSSFLEEKKWITVTVYVIVRHEDGSPAVFTIGFSILDTIGADRQEMQDRLQENYRILEGMASEYTAVYHFSLDTGSYKNYVTAERVADMKKKIGEYGSAFELYSAFVESDMVHPDSREALRDFARSAEDVRKALADRKKISMRFKCRYREEYLWTEISFVKCEPVDAEAHEIIAGFIECDAEVRSEQIIDNCLMILGESQSPNLSVNEMLSDAGEFYGADRAYIFEFDRYRELMDNTYEWCAAGVESMIDKLQNVEISEIAGWIAEFELQGAFFMDTLDEHSCSTPAGIELLRIQGIERLVAAPIMKGNEIIGFVGVDNPTRSQKDLGVLRTVATIAYSEILRRKENDEEHITLGKLTDAFVSVYFVDLSIDYCHTWKIADEYKDAYGDTQFYSVSMGGYVRTNIAERDRERCIRLTSPEYVIKQFATRDRFSIEMADIMTDHERNFVFDYIKVNEKGTQFVMCCRDVTENLVRERAQQALLQDALTKANEANQRNAILNRISKAGPWAFYFDKDDKPVNFYFSPECSEVIRNDVADGDQWMGLIYPEDLDHVLAGFGATVTDRSCKTVYDEEYRVRSAGGEYHWIRSVGYMMRNADGTSELYGICTDIDDIVNRRSEEQRQRHLKSFGDMINAALWSVDISGEHEITGVNWSNEFRRMFGFDNPEEFPDTLEAWSDRLHPEDRQRVLDDFWLSVRKKTEAFVYNLKYRIKRRTGEYCWYHSIGRIEIISGDARRMYGIIVDISAEKRIEEQQKQLEEALAMAQSANKAKSEFLFNMSHDIRTPMNAILGYTDIALRHFENPTKAKDSLRKIRTSGGHLLSLINDILEMSRIEAGTLELSEDPVDVREAAQSVDNMGRALAIPKSITFKTVIGEIRHRYLYADQLHINELIINLISNAVKYTPEHGKVTYRVNEVGLNEEGKAVFRFEVSDTGIGISEEFQKHLFETFAREKTSTVSKQEGSGLGLAIVKRITDLAGGKINVQSKLGEGSTFIIEMPFLVMDDEAIEVFKCESRNNNEIVQDVALTGRRVLLAEDNEMNREIAEAILSEFGLVVETAEDGDIAVRKFTEMGANYYDFVLMDIQMPVMDGYEATRQIRKLPGGRKVPIIALSANAFDEDIQKSLEAGMNSHIAKPIDTKLLFETLRDMAR